MKDDRLEEGSAEEHGEPVSVDGDAFGGGWDVVKGFGAVAEPVIDGLSCVGEEAEDFGGVESPDLAGFIREPGVHVIDRDGVMGPVGVGSKMVEEKLDHVALAMVWRWFMGKDNQLHRSVRAGRLIGSVHWAKTFLTFTGAGWAEVASAGHCGGLEFTLRVGQGIRPG